MEEEFTLVAMVKYIPMRVFLRLHNFILNVF